MLVRVVSVVYVMVLHPPGIWIVMAMPGEKQQHPNRHVQHHPVMYGGEVRLMIAVFVILMRPIIQIQIIRFVMMILGIVSVQLV